MSAVEIGLAVWAIAATALWLVERLPEPKGKANIAETSDTDPRDIPSADTQSIASSVDPDEPPAGVDGGGDDMSPFDRGFAHRTLAWSARSRGDEREYYLQKMKADSEFAKARRQRDGAGVNSERTANKR